jgi:chemotaxis methyl-accepting protein methylase
MPQALLAYVRNAGTSFFRDAPAFEELASKVLAGLVRERDQNTPGPRAVTPD